MVCFVSWSFSGHWNLLGFFFKFFHLKIVCGVSSKQIGLISPRQSSGPTMLGTIRLAISSAMRCRKDIDPFHGTWETRNIRLVAANFFLSLQWAFHNAHWHIMGPAAYWHWIMLYLACFLTTGMPIIASSCLDWHVPNLNNQFMECHSQLGHPSC